MRKINNEELCDDCLAHDRLIMEDDKKRKFVASCIKQAFAVQGLHLCDRDRGPYWINEISVFGPTVFLEPSVFMKLFKHEEWRISGGKFKIIVNDVVFEAPIPSEMSSVV